MTPGAGPTEHLWQSRAELLAARAEAVPEIERQLLSPWRLLGRSALALVTVLAAGMGGMALQDRGGSDPVVAVVCFLVAVAATVPVIRAARRNRALFAELAGWEEAERQGRWLPTGALRPELRMPVDARNDADFDQVAIVATVAAYTRPWGVRLLLRAVPAGLGVALGLALVLGGTSELPQPVAVASLLSGGYLLLSSLVVAGAATRHAYRMTRRYSDLATEIDALDLERSRGART
ncbi:hypothetical protein [Blastococcus sp. TF02A-35]|uniref:hypothetical protein n=1 Tax=Blastococcus sp. TF02A-35 TaxID=2559612 RepID=UPI00142F8C7E|nr:hypothetical protein [Blastococcus sp. TF02A_35]